MEYLIDQKLVTATLVDINWERIFVYFDIKLTFDETFADRDSLDFYAVNNLNAAKAKLKLIHISEDIYRLRINITNNGENRCLPIGTYRILVCQEDAVLAECESDFAYPVNMEDKTRNFMYANRNNVYAVDFYIADSEKRLPFRMYTLIAKKTGTPFPSNRDYKIHFAYEGIKKYFKSHRVFVRNMYRLFRKVYRKDREKTILFMTEQNSSLKSNLKAVYERMLARGMDKEYTILVSTRPAAAKSQPRKTWIELTRKLAQSGLIFLDDHAPVFDWLKLASDTQVVQLWHAGAGFKSSGYSRWGHKGCPSPQCCHRQYTYGIAGSKNIAPFFSEVWGINDEQVLPTGMPRMDEFLDENYRAETTERLYNEYPLCSGKKVLLFAPTYRGKNKKTAHYPYSLIDFERLYQLCGEEYVVLFKMHPWVKSAVPIPEEFKDKFVDVNRYPNINDLFYITDLLITDYSSNIFEYSLMRKPMLFFAFDKIQYSFSRGFHRDYEESAPGKVCYTFDELMEAFEKRDFEYEKVEQYIEHHFDFIDSHSSDRVIDWIVLKQLPEEIKQALEDKNAEIDRMKHLSFKRQNKPRPQQPEDTVESALSELDESGELTEDLPQQDLYPEQTEIGEETETQPMTTSDEDRSESEDAKERFDFSIQQQEDSAS